ncbi:MAG: F0F1 ATP synthase subunit gamma [Armatimonadetes bacterium]|nr:F0F1 ATP synthase subunit gamma [Gemmatimonadales bacterium]NIO75917.1 F0F1 ATP synthase subunit gamma [Armatimonadota bacterium]
MQTLEELQAKIDTADDLRSVVKTMKALAALSIRHFQEAVDSLRDYHHTVEFGLRIALRNRPEELSVAAPIGSKRAGAIIIGSDQGMCGQFNEDIARYAARKIGEMGIASSDGDILAIGLRLPFPLEQVGIQPGEVFSIPTSLSGITPLVQDILLKMDRWRDERGVDRVMILHNQPTSRQSYRSNTRQLLPVDADWLQALEERRWTGKTLPMFTVGWDSLFSALIRQHLLVSVYQSVLESLAAENASRMASMQAAERNIEERIQELRKQFHQQRQSSITAELLDIVGGFEALSAESQQ